MDEDKTTHVISPKIVQNRLTQNKLKSYHLTISNDKLAKTLQRYLEKHKKTCSSLVNDILMRTLPKKSYEATKEDELRVLFNCGSWAAHLFIAQNDVFFDENKKRYLHLFKIQEIQLTADWFDESPKTKIKGPLNQKKLISLYKKQLTPYLRELAYYQQSFYSNLPNQKGMLVPFFVVFLNKVKTMPIPRKSLKRYKSKLIFDITICSMGAINCEMQVETIPYAYQKKVDVNSAHFYEKLKKELKTTTTRSNIKYLTFYPLNSTYMEFHFKYVNYMDFSSIKLISKKKTQQLSHQYSLFPSSYFNSLPEAIKNKYDFAIKIQNKPKSFSSYANNKNWLAKISCREPHYLSSAFCAQLVIPDLSLISSFTKHAVNSKIFEDFLDENKELSALELVQKSAKTHFK